MPIDFDFEWDPSKARANAHKHAVEFGRAAQIFRDPMALTIPDEEHSESEQRWITLGHDFAGQCLLVVHTLDQISANDFLIRIISARRPTRSELLAYEQAQ